MKKVRNRSGTISGFTQDRGFNPVPWNQNFTDIHTIFTTSGQRSDNNPCAHHVVVQKLHPMTSETWNPTFPPSQNPRTVRTNWCSAPSENGVPIGPMPLGYLGRAFSSLRPKSVSDTNIMNFIYELGDIRRTVEWVLGGFIKLFQNGIRKGLAGNTLAYNFGIAPLVGDIQKLMSSYSDFLQMYDKVVGQAGKKNKAHYTERVQMPATEKRSKQLTWERVDSYDAYEVIWTSVFSYSYTLAAPPPPKNLQTYARYLGFRFSRESIWNAIPFSFCIDWVLKVGKFLSHFDEGTIPVSITVHGCTTSYKAERKGRYQFIGKGSSPSIYSTPGTAMLGTLYEKSYVRARTNPSTLQKDMILPQVDGLSIKELVLAIALLGK